MKYYYPIFLILLVFSVNLYGQNTSKFYVALNGSDFNSGSIDKPFETITKALNEVATLKRNGLQNNIQIIFRKGVYYVNKTLQFDSTNSGDLNHTVTFMSYPGEKVIISGGRRLTQSWTKENAHIWKYKYIVPGNESMVFRSLYMDDKRLVRSQSPTLFTTGELPKFKKSFKMNAFDRAGIGHLKQDSLEAFCGFSYNNNDLSGLSDIKSADLILYASWDASWHRIYQIDSIKHTVLLKSPTNYPVGFFNTRTRYRVENVEKYLSAVGNWFYNEETGYIYYYGNLNENPNNETFYIPVLSKLIVIKGNEANPVMNVKFIGISFEHTNSEWPINTTPKSLQDASKAMYPWLDFSTGFNSTQGALASGQAILLQYAKNCDFYNCEFAFLDDYAISVGIYSNGNAIANCNMHDCGSGGFVIGFDNANPIGFPPQVSPSYNSVKNCKIYNCGLLHPSGIGIMVIQANHTTVDGNTIYNMPYSGISCGWTFDDKDNFTSYNTVSRNIIHDVMTQLTDGAGIYTLGKQVGTVFKNNYIYNINRPDDAIGSQSNGFFFDQFSSQFLLDSNVVYNVKNGAIRFNQTNASKLNIGYNYFEKMNSNKELKNIIYRKLTQ